MTRLNVAESPSAFWSPLLRTAFLPKLARHSDNTASVKAQFFLAEARSGMRVRKDSRVRLEARRVL